MNKILVVLLVSAAIGMAMPAMADPFADSMQTSGAASNWKNIGPIAVTGTNSIANTVTQTLTSSGAQGNTITGDILAGSGDAVNGAANALTATATSGGATSGGAGSGTATSGGATLTDAMTQTGGGELCCGSAETEAETGDAKSKAETGSASSGDAKVKDNDQTAKANNNVVYSGDAKNKDLQTNVVSQEAKAIIHNDQTLTQKVKIREFQIAKSQANPYVEMDDSQFAEGNNLYDGSKIKNDV
jgi:hypothetical protein